MDRILDNVFKRSIEIDSTLKIERLKDKLLAYKPQLLWMDETGGQPTIIKYKGDLLIVDLSKESPNRRNLCYDKDARLSRKKFPPKSSVLELCFEKKVNLVDEDLYRHMQTLKPLDMKTSTWIKTPDTIRKNGGAIFCDCRYDEVFTYHNGADSYYSSRGFRAYIKL